MSKVRKVYLFGNGFDIDLGLKSRYSDYAESRFWPFQPGNNGFRLGEFLNRKKEIDTWFDLEAALGEYALLASRNAIDEAVLRQDKIAFELLLSTFTEYIGLQQRNTIPDKESLAAALIRHFSTDDADSRIFTFNFTDLNDLAAGITSYNKFEYHHIHGSWKEDSLIMGFGDTVLNVAPEYNFMRKSFSAKYKPPTVIRELLDAQTVVLFGLSMGDIDYSYYDYFFRRLSTPEESCDKEPKRIIIFAYDDAARMSILDNLYQKTNAQLSNLNALNSFRMVTIKAEKKQDILKLIKTI